MGKMPEELYKEREKRVDDAIQLRVPDRVPFWFQDISFFPAKYVGITFEKLMVDDEAFVDAYKKTITAFEPDMYFNPGHALHTPGDALDTIDCKQVKWPGHGVPSHHTFQFIEGEYMKADEYDAFIDDPTDFTIRTYLPRVHGALAPLGTLPPPKALLLGYFGLPLSSAFTMPEIASAFESFYRAGLAITRHNTAVFSLNKELKALGFPLACGAITLAPFDVLSDTLRGMRGLMLDMYRQPDKVLQAMEKLLPMMIGLAVIGAKLSGTPRIFIPLHRGADGFMSLKQFETFYWNTLKRLILALIDNGLTPCPFFEGDYTSRLAYLAALPKGKVLGLFDRTDIYKAKEALKGTMCISGMMPLSLLQTGTPGQIKEYAKKLIDVVGKGGGFVMGPRSAMDEADPKLVKVWADFTKEYGVYR
jgi:Uroporphyrinogen decarboxylase (URO-D)